MPAQLDPISVAKFTYAFKCLDTNRNGKLESDDFVRLARHLKKLHGWADDNPRIQAMRGELLEYWEMLCMLTDNDGSGDIDLEEFLHFHRLMIEETVEFEEAPPWAQALVDTLMTSLDTDGDGRIGVDEYANLLLAMRSEMDPIAAFSKLDREGGGYLELSTLSTLMAEYLTSTDPEAPGNYLLTGGWPR